MENNQTLKLWYESGAVDVYYGHKRKRLKDLTPKEEDAYWLRSGTVLVPLYRHPQHR
jgi:hypothetical protein